MSSSCQKGGACPSQAATGFALRDAVGTEELTTSQGSTDYIRRMNATAASVGVVQQGIIRERVGRVSRAHATGDGKAVPPDVRYELGDLLDFWRAPGYKGLKGWRGLAELVNKSHMNDKGKVSIEWGGKTLTVPLDHVRPHIMDIVFLYLFTGEASTGMVQLMAHLGENLPFYSTKLWSSVVSGKVDPTPSSSARSYYQCPTSSSIEGKRYRL